MQEQVYQTPIHDVNDLKQRLLDVWAMALDQRIIDNDVQLFTNGASVSWLACKQREGILNIFFN